MASEWIEVGTDRVETITGLVDADGNYLNAATITYALKDASGTTVSGATGSYSYTAASDGDYAATIDAVTTALLTPGQTYYLHVSVDQGSYEATSLVFARPTRLPASSAVITAETYMEATGQTLTGAALLALRAVCASADRAIKDLCRPHALTPTTVTDAVLDAPPERVLRLPVVPVRSVTSLYFRYAAKGDPSVFTSDDRLVEFTDFYMPVDPVDGFSPTGHVLTLNRGAWAAEYYRRVGRLADTLGPAPGAVKCSWLAGPAGVAANVFEAAKLVVSKLRLAGRFGGQPTGASLNGASYTLAASAVAGVFSDPTIADLLRRHLSIGVA